MVFLSVKFRGKWIKLKQSNEGVYGKEENENKDLLKAQLFSGDAENIR